MKTRRFVLALLAVCMLLTGSLAQNGQTYELASAVQTGKARLKVKALGGSSGDTLDAEVWRGPKAPSGPMTLTILPGTMATTSDSGMQGMAIFGVVGEAVTGVSSIQPGAQNLTALSKSSRRTGLSLIGFHGQGRAVGTYRPVTSITLIGNQHKHFILEAYCANFDLDNPKEKSPYALSKQDKMLAAIFKEIARRNSALSKAGKTGLSVQAKQAAVWIYTDKVTFEHVNEKFAVSKSDFQTARDIVSKCRKEMSK